MLAPNIDSTLGDYKPVTVLPEELDFYQSYAWCLNPHITAREAIRHLEEGVFKLASVRKPWQFDEVVTNILLLSCGLLNCVDGYLGGPTLRLPGGMARSRFGRTANRLVDMLSSAVWRRSRVARWRQQWLAVLNNFLSFIVAAEDNNICRVIDSARKLTSVLKTRLPVDLLAKRLSIPSPFGHLDLTPNDVLRLGNAFICQFPERGQPIVLVGLRTSGSYFAPLLNALLQTQGYRAVELLTVEPKKGPGRWERQALEGFAARGFWALILDDPPHSSETIFAALDMVQRAGFGAGQVKIVAPTHPARPNWFQSLPGNAVITQPPEQWHKRELLHPKAVELRLAEYFGHQNFASASVVASRNADEFNAHLQRTPTDKRLARLKRVFEVQLETPAGETQTRYVLAKSVGWGWLGYRAFLMGYQLSGYVPPVLGLRDGILFMEWVPNQPIKSPCQRNELLAASASYTAARVRRLNLSHSAARMDLKRSNNGHLTLAYALSQAYGRFLPQKLMRPRLAAMLRMHQCPVPTLVDGNMRGDEWILAPQGPLKSDYEHHGMGKLALNVIDPAYDLADTILHFELSEAEESRLIQQYIAESGDHTVKQRLFLNKLLAGLWAMNAVQEQLFDTPSGGDTQQRYHLRFMNAWNFLTVHTARHCGSLCHPRADLRWRAPLIFLDLDGIVDRRLFGFPASTAAGIEAISLLSAHDFSVALNTARSASEVKDYCSAYSLSGGVAEYGSYLWDAVHQREQVLISTEAARQLEEIRNRLRKIPGVFLDERHRYSVRAFSYQKRSPERVLSLLTTENRSSIGEGVLAPISPCIVHQLLADLRLDKLTFLQNSIDTTIVAAENNKGTGLAALRDWVLASEAETIAIGDDEPDLAMFRVATRSFAPANIGCRRQARLLGCQVAPYPYQRGLLHIVRNITHLDDGHYECAGGKNNPLGEDDLFFSALQAGDERWSANLLRAILHPAASFSFFIH